jgi:hypothetical protein
MGILGAAGTAVDASGVAAAVVAVDAVSALVGGAVGVQPTSANIIVPRMLATPGRSGAAITRLRLTVFTSVECVARSESFVSDRMRSMRWRLLARTDRRCHRQSGRLPVAIVPRLR